MTDGKWHNQSTRREGEKITHVYYDSFRVWGSDPPTHWERLIKRWCARFGHKRKVNPDGKSWMFCSRCLEPFEDRDA